MRRAGALTTMAFVLGLLSSIAWQARTPVHADEEQAAAPEYSRTGADTCARCHDEESEFPVLDIFKTPHGNRHDERAPFAGLQCESCHGPGSDHSARVRRGQERPKMLDFGRDAATPVEEQNAVCTGCHEQELGVSWHGGAHDVENVACADCHDVHAERDAVFNVATQPEVCFTCHRNQKTQSYKFSTHPIRYGKMACTSCHEPHGSTSEFELVRNNLNETCYSCHTEKRGPFLWEHAPASEDCSSCHRAHGSNHPALLTKRQPLLCQQCHSQADHPSIAHTSSGLPPSGASSFLLGRSCTNCHSQVHGTNHPSGARLTR